MSNIDTRAIRFECDPEDTTCKDCRGELCCQHNPCAYYPTDFGSHKEEILANVEKAVREDKASLRYAREIGKKSVAPRRIDVIAPGWDDPDCYEQGSKIVVPELVDKLGYEKNFCLFWRDDSGCLFSLEERPLGGAIYSCSKLREVPGGAEEYAKRDAKISAFFEEHPGFKDWSEYQKELRELAVKLAQEKSAN